MLELTEIYLKALYKEPRELNPGAEAPAPPRRPATWRFALCALILAIGLF